MLLEVKPLPTRWTVLRISHFVPYMPRVYYMSYGGEVRISLVHLYSCLLLHSTLSLHAVADSTRDHRDGHDYVTWSPRGADSTGGTPDVLLESWEMLTHAGNG